MVAARRARPHWLRSMWPLFLVPVLIAAAVLYLLSVQPEQPAAATSVQTTNAPAPQPTWTSYVPQMPAECFDMLDAGNEMYRWSLKSDTAIIAARKLEQAKKYSAAVAKWDEAARASKRLGRARSEYVDRYNACLKAP